MATVNGLPVLATDGVIEGTDLDDIIDGGAADSGIEIRGLDGNDIMTATAGSLDVTLNGGAGIDALESSLGARNTTMDGGPGADDLLGFGMNDTASYANDPAGVMVNLSAGQATDGYGDTDLLFRIENVTGSSSPDSLTGDAGANVLQGGAGDDTLKGEGGNDVFKYSFTLDEAPGEAKTFKFTDWLSEKYGKEFGDQLPDFERGHDHGRHHQKHGGRDDHGRHDDNGHYNQKHGGCDDHQPQQYGLSKAFFAQNYSEWLKEVVVVDLLAQGLDLDTNDNGRVGVRLNQYDPDGTPRIEGLTNDQLLAIFDGRDEVTLRHGHHGHDWSYSNIYKSSSSEGKTTVASEDGFDTIVDFGNGADKLQFNFSADSSWADGQADSLAYLESFFNIDRDDFTSDAIIDTRLSVDMNDDGNAEWSVVLASNDSTDAQVFAALDIYVNDILIG